MYAGELLRSPDAKVGVLDGKKKETLLVFRIFAWDPSGSRIEMTAIAQAGSTGPGPTASTHVADSNAASQTTSAIVLCDTTLASSKLARLCQRGALLLPVANRPIIQYILDTLVRSGIRKVTFAGTDEVSCDALSMYLTSAAGAPAQQNVSVDVVCDPSCGKSSVSLIRRVLASDLSSSVVVDRTNRAPRGLSAAHGNDHDEDVLVIGSLFVSPGDVSLEGQMMYHKVKKAAVTMMLSRAVADDDGEYPTREYVAVGSDGIVAAYCPVGTSKSGDIKVPAVALFCHPNGRGTRLRLHKDVMDTRVYVFNKGVLSQVLRDNEGLLDVQRHLIPYFVRRTAALSVPNVSGNGAHQSLRQGVGRGIERLSSSNLSGSGGETDRERVRWGDNEGPGLRTAVLAYVPSASVSAVTEPTASIMPRVAGSLSSASTSMMIVDSEVSYANVNRDILKNLERSSIAEGVTLGSKAAVGNGSIVGMDSSLGDRASVKRSVVGPNCRIGSNTKIINSILHEGCKLGDGCHVQNSILCRGVTVDPKGVLKDCVVGPNQALGSDVHKVAEFFD